MLGSFIDYWSSVPSDGEWRLIKVAYETTYLMWGALWTLVAFHYYVAAHSSWLQQGGKYRNAAADLWQPLGYAYARLWRSLCRKGVNFGCWIMRRSKPVFLSEDEVPGKYSIGHYLRFSIFLGAIAPALIGLTLFAFDRSHLYRVAILANQVAMMLSIFGAIGHLFIAYHGRPTVWTRLVMWSTIWLVISPILFYIVDWP